MFYKINTNNILVIMEPFLWGEIQDYIPMSLCLQHFYELINTYTYVCFYLKAPYLIYIVKSLTLNF